MSDRDYQRIAQAIGFITARAPNPPSLNEVAAHLGLSEYHFQRLFRRWAGVSPKQFAQYLTAQHARACLRGAASVLDASLAVGLSGPGRLHDVCVVVHAASPGELKSGGADLLIRHARHDTPFGPCLAAATPRGLCHLSFLDTPDTDDALARLRRQWPQATLLADPAPTARVIAALFTDIRPGLPRPTTPDCALHLSGTQFQLRVWEALLQIPPGAVTTYAHIARQLGQPGAARAVGNAVGANPVAWLIPCHRVIRQTGLIGGYRWGTTRKRAMLGWEAAHGQRDVPAPPAVAQTGQSG